MLTQTFQRLRPACACFAAGTLVWTDKGVVPIEQIKVGDWVLSHPENVKPSEVHRVPRDFKFAYRQVTRTFVHEDKLVSNLTAWDMANDIEETIKVTPNHPVFEQYRGWIPVDQLKFGRVVKNRGLADLMVKDQQPTQERMRVFNIEVDEFHTYCVGKLGVWVHNKSNNLVEKESIPEKHTASTPTALHR